MPIAPIRDLGSTGVITDIDPFDLPPNAFTMAVNARFDDSKVARGPVFRTVGLLSNTSPRHLLTFSDAGGNQVSIVANLDGTVQNFVPAANYSTPTITNISASGWSLNNAEIPYTSFLLNDVVYLNRADRVPWYRLRGGTTFDTLPVWDSTWRATSLRGFAGVVMALGISKGGISYPTTVKWSDLTTFQGYPGTWTPTVGNSAGETPLSDMADTIVDGFPLRDRFVIYGTNEVWNCTQTLDNNVFSFKRSFRDGGLINQNCIVEIAGTHYVFGPYDIYKTDGFSKSSIIKGKNWQFVFQSLQRTEANRFFAVHNPKLSEIEFYYVSNDRFINFPYVANASLGCNRSACYNYTSDTWVFRDQPYIVYAGTGSISSGQTTDGLSSTFDQQGGAFSSFSDISQKTFIVAGLSYGPVTASLYSYDLPDSTGTNAPMAFTATAPMYLEKTWMDMDEVGAELRGYKVLSSMYPQGRFTYLNENVTFTLGGANYTGDTVTWEVSQVYDGLTNYKLDYMSGGRYLSYKMLYSGYTAFSLSGFDADITITGSR